MTGEEESNGWLDPLVGGGRESNGTDKIHEQEEREKVIAEIHKRLEREKAIHDELHDREERKKAMALTRSTSNRRGKV